MRLRFEVWGYILTIEPHQTREDAPQGAGIGGSIPYSKLRSDPDSGTINVSVIKPYRLANAAEEGK